MSDSWLNFTKSFLQHLLIILCFRLNFIFLSGPSLANGRPCSNCASESTSPPLPLPSLTDLLFFFPSPAYPSPSLHSLSPPRREAAPLKPTRMSGGAESSPSGVLGRAPAAVEFCCIVCSQNASGCSICGSLVSIAMSPKWRPLKLAALFGRTPRTCLRPALFPLTGTYWLFCVT